MKEFMGIEHPSSGGLTVENVSKDHPILIMTAGDRVLSKEPIHSSDEFLNVK
jgi:hypothetical protein